VAESDAERTEAPSERRIQQFRDEGKVAQSKELLAGVGLAAGGAALLLSAGMFADAFRAVFDALRQHLGDRELTTSDVHLVTGAIFLNVGPPLLLVLAAGSLTSLLAGLLLTNFNVAPGALEPKWSRLNPLANFQQQFMSAQPWVQLARSVAVGSLVAWAAWSAVATHLDSLPVLAALDPRAQAAWLVELVSGFLQRVIPVGLAIGAADYGWQWWRLQQELKMTKEDVKREHKEQEGDPKIKGKRRQVQRQIAMGQMLGRVKEADVVVVNPTHYAVALRYRKEEGRAPVVVARGVDHLALKIRAEATRHEVAIIENRPLARGLYARARLGLPIPAEFYGAVAQLLAIVYRKRAQSRMVQRPG
jgi:flagellar biosynthetic protein FlhB